MRVGLNDAEGGEFWKVEAFGDHLGTDYDIVIAGANVVVNFVEGLCGVSVGVKAGDIGVRKEAVKFVFDSFGAEAFVMDAGVVAFRARGGNGVGASAGMAAHLEFVGMENQG